MWFEAQEVDLISGRYEKIHKVPLESLFTGTMPGAMLIDGVSVQIQGGNIRQYHSYLLFRAKAFGDTRIDWVREGKGRLKRQTIDKGLLRETEIVQKQIAALLKCEVESMSILSAGVADYYCTAFLYGLGKRDHTDRLPTADHGSTNSVSCYE